jgi:hypothetical protein
VNLQKDINAIKTRREDHTCRKRRNGCTDCGDKFGLAGRIMAPILPDLVWRRRAAANETLYGVCVFIRGVRLTLVDLRPCPFNLRGAAFFLVRVLRSP